MRQLKLQGRGGVEAVVAVNANRLARMTAPRSTTRFIKVVVVVSALCTLNFRVSFIGGTTPPGLMATSHRLDIECITVELWTPWRRNLPKSVLQMGLVPLRWDTVHADGRVPCMRLAFLAEDDQRGAKPRERNLRGPVAPPLKMLIILGAARKTARIISWYPRGEWNSTKAMSFRHPLVLVWGRAATTAWKSPSRAWLRSAGVHCPALATETPN